MLEGKRVLVVEDEPIVAMLIEDMLLDLGAEVIGPAARVDQALALVESEQFDLAVLDVNLAGQRSYSVADLLIERGIPFVFATGYGEAGAGEAYGDIAVLQKPYRQADVETALTAALEKAGR